MKKEKSKKWHFPKVCTIVILISFLVLEIRMAYIALLPRVDGINIQEFAKNRNTTTKILKAQRGVIYDVSGNVLAQNVTSYTVVAILSDSRPDRVIDKEMTAEKLSGVLGATREGILKLLNYRVYQVELGPWGRGINIQKKEEIEALNTTFDPNFHEAVMHVEDENYGEKEVTEVFRKGYKIGSKVIRHSMVVVAN